MKDLHKSPMLYYILIPLAALAWPAAMWFKYMPAMADQRETWKGYVADTNDLIVEILTLDPERLNYSDQKDTSVEFEYEMAVDKVARSLRMGNQYELRPSAKSGNKQAAEVSLNNIGIIQCSQFLSTLQMHWNGLQCTRLGITNKKTTKDRWDVTMSFT
ncbi:MAG: hypothetical protein GY809_16835, partial [Planctomycetes bacterium]|nr:hypothetical protein [Planctomycetota bacterium]